MILLTFATVFSSTLLSMLVFEFAIFLLRASVSEVSWLFFAYRDSLVLGSAKP
jgi:hypothetical protein